MVWGEGDVSLVGEEGWGDGTWRASGHTRLELGMQARGLALALSPATQR